MNRASKYQSLSACIAAVKLRPCNYYEVGRTVQIDIRNAHRLSKLWPRSSQSEIVGLGRGVREDIYQTVYTPRLSSNHQIVTRISVHIPNGHGLAIESSTETGTGASWVLNLA